MPGPNKATSDSILGTTKKLLGLDMSLTDFDIDLIININSAFNVLTQLGVGPKRGFQITGLAEEWCDYIKDNIRLNMVKQYVYMKTRIAFDPPQIGSLMTSLENQIKELEFRLNVQVDPEETFSVDEYKEDYHCEHYDNLDCYPDRPGHHSPRNKRSEVGRPEVSESRWNSHGSREEEI